MEHPRELQVALRDLREHVTAIGASKRDAIEFAASVERVAHAFCADRLIGAVRDPLSQNKASIKRLASALGRASLVARGVQDLPGVARDLSMYRKARGRKKTPREYRDFVTELGAWARTAEQLLQEIEVRRGPNADDPTLALYTAYAIGYRKCTGEWPRGWRQSKSGGEPASWRPLHAIVMAISTRIEGRLTTKRFYSAVQKLAAKARPVSETSDK